MSIQLKNNIRNYYIKINKDNLNKKTINDYTNIIYNIYNHFSNDYNDFEPYFFISNIYDILDYLLNIINDDKIRISYIKAILNILKYYDNYDDEKINRIIQYYYLLL